MAPGPLAGAGVKVNETGIYDHPDLYDLAFAWRDPAREWRKILALIHTVGCPWPRRVLDLACGTSLLAPVAIVSGCAWRGIDPSPTMRAGARGRAPAARFEAGTLLDSAPGPRADLVLNLLGCLYLDDHQLESHLALVARCLVPGGCYLLEWPALHDPISDHHDRWRVRSDDTAMVCDFAIEALPGRRMREVMRLRGWRSGSVVRCREEHVSRCWSAEELARRIRAQGDFDLLGIWNDGSPKRPLPRPAGEPITRPMWVLGLRGARAGRAQEVAGSPRPEPSRATSR